MYHLKRLPRKWQPYIFRFKSKLKLGLKFVMKIIAIILFVLMIIVLTGIYTMKNTKTETQKYEVLFSKNNFEIRFYPEAILATVQMNGSYDNSRNSGFGVLVGYIFGGNNESTKIAMTSPVRISTGNYINTMSFVLPSEMDFEKLPNPDNPNIVLHKSIPIYSASIRFGGYANDSIISEYKLKLNEILAQINLKHTGKFEFLGYNSPYQPVNRRNEIQVELVGFNPYLFKQETDKNPEKTNF